MNLTEQLRILSIFHYVIGAIYALFSCFGLIYLLVGFVVIKADASAIATDFPGGDLDFWFGTIFVTAGAVIILLGLSLAFLTILSGRFIARRTHRTFSLIMAAVNCVAFPLGTALGIFDFILLTKDETRNLYEAEDAAAELKPPL